MTHLNTPIKRPEEFGELVDGSFTYESSHHSTDEAPRINVPGTSIQRYNQRKIIGKIEAVLSAISLLDCGGGILIDIHPDAAGNHSCTMRVDMYPADQACKVLIEESVAEIEDLARELYDMNPKAEFSTRFVMHTKYTDVRLIVSPCWKSTAPKVHLA